MFNDQSNQKVKSRRISSAGSYLKPLLVQVANALIKSKKHPKFKERYHRIKPHRGHKKAIIAVCKMLLTAIWNMLRKLEPYNPEEFLEHRPLNFSGSGDIPSRISSHCYLFILYILQLFPPANC